MERMSSELIQKQYLADEHVARYKHFSSFMFGKVVDCACGIGYASKLVMLNDNVDNYTGIDISEDAIETANSHFLMESNAVQFKLGSILDIPEHDRSVDTFISMETLEHLEESNVALALCEIKRVLKNDGVFIGSVPIDQHDEKCKSVYGESPYHITRFNYDKLQTLLTSEFDNVYIGKMTREVISLFETASSDTSTEVGVELLNADYPVEHGSYLFICSNKDYDFSSTGKLYLSQSLVEYDEEQVMPYIKSMRNAEDLALKRAEIIEDMEAHYTKEVLSLKDEVAQLKKESEHGDHQRKEIDELCSEIARLKEQKETGSFFQRLKKLLK
ncbi:methyltransferase family protein [Vibrio diazotrophicus]|uniref:Methyltransferase family protein n=1 Tax=Vibrio diazotrophicus TaxID=685 RepID=A0A329DW10_VIBDI|nr:class I SAM-dependent methyltransferase [Vibrio diazotrophicus]RAS54435.1 methyltransferase family protein [Vibrio diazotrophicus]